MVARLGRWRTIVCLGGVAWGCAGKSVAIEGGVDDDELSPVPTTEAPPAPTDTPEAPPAPTDTPEPPPAPADTPEPPPEPPPTPPPTPIEQPVTPPSCDETALSAELAWSAQGPGYGLAGPGMLSFSPDGSRVATTGDFYSTTVLELDVATGAPTFTSADHEVVYGRDAGWRYELRGEDDVIHAVDLENGGDAFRRELAEPVRAAALSDDGRYVGTLGCRDGKVLASRFPLAGGEPREIFGAGCEAYVDFAVFALVEKGNAALFSWGTAGTVTRLDFETGSTREVYLHALTYTSGSVFGIALSPDARIGVSAGGDDIRAWSYPALEPLFEPIPIPVLPSFTNCYVGRRFMSGLAFSPDGRFVAMPGEGSALTIRRTCDFTPVLQIDSDAAPTCSHGDEIPMGLVAFSPRGDRLAAWWGGDVGMYLLR